MGTRNRRTFVWLPIRNRCWTANRLLKRGLQHPERCMLCDQEEKTIQCILMSCVFARQFWCAILQQLDFARLTPTRRSSFSVWWKKAERKLQKHLRKGFNSFCILGAWIIWKHRIACVFDGSRHLTYRRMCRLLRMKRTLGSSSGPKGCLSSTSS